jgi:TPR repeat protein
MTKRRIGIGTIFLLLVAVGLLVQRQEPALLSAKVVAAPVIEVPTPIVAERIVPKSSISISTPESLPWSRPPAASASRSYQRSGLAWILRQLGASEKLLDRLVDGDPVAAITELKQQAQGGDAAAINILGELAYQRCYLGRDDKTLSEYEASQLTNARALPAKDLAWFSTALRGDIAYDKQFNSVCKQLIDQDQVRSWVAARAKQGDGASIWLLFNSADNMTDMQQRLRDAAAAGFPEAQFELAWAIIGGQQGAAGTGPDAMNAGDLLRQSAEQLPTAEAELAVCEYSGCAGITPDLVTAVAHARDAAEKGSIDAMIAIGPHLSVSQIDPDEVTAWKLVNASLQQQGCAGNGFTVSWMKSTTSILASTSVSPRARILADQYWRDYGSRMMVNLGCTS